MLRLLPRLSDEPPRALIEAGIPAQLARLLGARGVETAAEAEAFLSPSADNLHDPMLLHDMPAAVERVLRAVEREERIVVYGDYDVDGVCASALLVEALRAHGAQADWYIPSRHKEGYGLNPQAVQTLAERCSLLITVDCGITSVEEAKLANSLGLDMIITDHHEPSAQLPQALAVVDPLLGAYPFRRLCGAGVALKLVWALFGEAAVSDLWELAALATVADLVPLLGENRVIAYEGLRRMQGTSRAGIKALLQVAGISGKTITAGHLGFQIGPRINAGGRLREASRNVELLLTEDDAVAADIAFALQEENTQRQRMEADILCQADAWVQAHVDFLSERAIIVVGRDWNPGVVGLVASRLVERYAWPTLVLSENEEGIVTGSARSIPGVNMHTALTRCQHLFIRFGGHAQAAGMTLRAEALPALREMLSKAIDDIAEEDAFIPSLYYDMDISLGEVTVELTRQFEQLAPTGFGNPAPVFRLYGAQVLEARTVGADGKHLKLRLSQEGAALDGIAFGQGSARAGLAQQVDVIFSPGINEYMGRVSAQLEVSRLLPHEADASFLAECGAREDDFDCYLLNTPPRTEAFSGEVLRALVLQALQSSCQGTLLTVSTLAGAIYWTRWLREKALLGRVDFCFDAAQDRRRFNTLCAMPRPDAGEGFQRVYALDVPMCAQAVRGWLPSDDTLRHLYKTLRAGQGRLASERAVAEAAGMRLAAVRLGLRVFEEMELVAYRPVPFSAELLAPKKVSLDTSETLRRIRGAYPQEGIV